MNMEVLTLLTNLQNIYTWIISIKSAYKNLGESVSSLGFFALGSDAKFEDKWM